MKNLDIGRSRKSLLVKIVDNACIMMEIAYHLIRYSIVYTTLICQKQFI